VDICVGGVLVRRARLKTRGHVSKLFPKQQFSLELPSPVGLLGMAPARRWVLAMSFIDTTYQRNPTAFEIYQVLGGWSPKTQYATLEWQGVDFGLYYIGETVELGPGRLQLPFLAGGDGHGQRRGEDPEAAGCLLTVDWPKEGKAWVKTGNTSTFFSFLSPAKKSLLPEQLRFVQGLVDKIDALAAGPDQADELGRYLDFDSFARFYVVQELARDVDGYAFSDYMAVGGGKLFHAAPWDFDLAFGFACMPLYYKNAFTGKDTSQSVAGWNVENIRDAAAWIGPTGLPGESVIEFGSNRRAFFLNIWGHARFRESFAQAWRAGREGPLSDDALRKMVEHRSQNIKRAALDDLSIWAHTSRCAFFRCCHPEAASNFTVARRALVGYLVNRARWIDSNVGGLLKARRA